MSPDSDTLSRAPGPPTVLSQSSVPRAPPACGSRSVTFLFLRNPDHLVLLEEDTTQGLAVRSCQEGSAGRAACHLLSPVPAARPCSRRHSSHQCVFCHHTGERYVRRLQTDPVPDRPPARRLQTAGPPVTAAAPSAPRERTAPLYPSRWPARLRRATGVDFPVTAPAPRCQPPGARTAPSLENSKVHAGGPCRVCFAPVCSLGLLTRTRLQALERRHRPPAGEELHQPTERLPVSSSSRALPSLDPHSLCHQRHQGQGEPLATRPSPTSPPSYEQAPQGQPQHTLGLPGSPHLQPPKPLPLEQEPAPCT